MPHDTLDVALLQLDLSAAGGATEIAPIAPAAPGAIELATGDVVELAGYGLTENGTARAAIPG